MAGAEERIADGDILVFDLIGNSLTGDFTEVLNFGKFGVFGAEFKNGTSDRMVRKGFAGDEEVDDLVFGIFIIEDFEFGDGEVAASQSAGFVEDNVLCGVKIVEVVAAFDEDAIFAGGANAGEIGERDGDSDGARARNYEEG